MAGISLAAVRLAKAELRKRMKQRLLSMTPEERHRQSSLLCSMFLSSEEYQKSKRIAIYLSMSDEINTEEIMHDIFKTKRHCFIPRYVGPNMDMLRLYSMEDYASLPLTKWKIKQPADDDKTRDDALLTGGLDLLLVPGLAFTRDGRRLGRGKGYYDSYLTLMKDKGLLPQTVALAYSFQICDEVPTTKDDFIIDKVIHNADSQNT